MFWSEVQKKWKIDVAAVYEGGKDTAMGFIYSNTNKPCPEEITEWFHGFQTSPDTSIAVVEGVLLCYTVQGSWLTIAPETSGRRRRRGGLCVDINVSGQLSESSCPAPGDPVAGDRLVLCKIGEILCCQNSVSSPA